MIQIPTKMFSERKKMSLFTELKEKRTLAMKEGNSSIKLLLDSLISDLEKLSKDCMTTEPTDEQVIKTIKKYIANADAIIDLPSSPEAKAESRQEIYFLSKYIPSQISGDELKNVIVQYLNSNPNSNIGSIMAFLKKNYTGKFDGAEASSIAKQVLK